MTAQPTIGKTYHIDHRRKGKFMGIVTHADDEWATVLITSGKARAMLDYNERETGETVTVRLSLATFTELEAATC